MHAPIDFIHKILMMVLSVPGTFLDAWDMSLSVSKTEESPCPHGVYITVAGKKILIVVERDNRYNE